MSVCKMAEVSRRFIDSGIHRLAAFRTTPSRPLCTEGSPGSLLNCASCHSPTKEENVHVLSQNGAGLVSEKLYRLKEAQNPPKNGTFLGAASFHLPSSRLICCTDPIGRQQACRTGLPISTGFLQEKLPTSSRSKGLVFIHSDIFRSAQHLRTFCTALVILTSTGSEKRIGELRLPHALRGSAATRGYSSRRKTYYDVLNVSPSATQSQIKTAYYKQSLIYHPDKNAGSKEASQRFSEISQAYIVLRNISKRRTYDQGILNQFNTGGQSTKETTSRFTGYHGQQKARSFYQPDGRPIYDFDAYYRAHYGEQLRRERAIRARKKQMEEMQKEMGPRWKHQRTFQLTFMLVVTMAGFIFISFTQS